MPRTWPMIAEHMFEHVRPRTLPSWPFIQKDTFLRILDSPRSCGQGGRGRAAGRAAPSNGSQAFGLGLQPPRRAPPNRSQGPGYSCDWANLDQGNGSTWTLDGAPPGPWMGLNLHQGWGSTCPRDGAQPGLWMGLSLGQQRGSTWSRNEAHFGHLAPRVGPSGGHHSWAPRLGPIGGPLELSHETDKA